MEGLIGGLIGFGTSRCRFIVLIEKKLICRDDGSESATLSRFTVYDRFHHLYSVRSEKIRC